VGVLSCELVIRKVVACGPLCDSLVQSASNSARSSLYKIYHTLLKIGFIFHPWIISTISISATLESVERVCNGSHLTSLNGCLQYVSTLGKSPVSELQCQFQGMSPVIYAPRMKVIHAFCGTFPVIEKVIYSFLYYYVIDNRRSI